MLRLDPPAAAQAGANLLDFDLQTDDFSEDRTRRRTPLKHRYPHVAPLLGYKVSYYERRKLWRDLYERIASHLQYLVETLAPPPPPPNAIRPIPPTRESVSLEYRLSYSRASALANDAAAVYYACLGALFVAKLHNEFRDDSDLDEIGRLNWDDACNWLLSQYCLLTFTFIGAEDGLLSLLSQLALLHLRWLRDLVALCSPFDSPEHDNRILMNATHLQQGVKMPFFRERALALHSLNTAWREWYATIFEVGALWPPHSFDSVSEDPLAVRLLAAISRNVVYTVMSQVDLGYSPLAEARRHACHVIYTFYSVDEWRPLGDGGTLGGRLDAFFDSIDQRLAIDYSVCYDREENKKELEEACQNVKAAWSAK